MKVYVTKEFHFEAAHHLINYDGECARLHGHSYKIAVTVSADMSRIFVQQDIATDCMVIDFKELKKVVNREVVSKYDHQNLNDFFGNPTAEVMVISMFLDIRSSLPGDIKLECVKLWETEGAYAECRGEM